MTGIQHPKPQLLVDTILIPKRKPVTTHKRQSKRTRSTPRKKPVRPTPPIPPSTPKKPALTRQERKEQGLCRCGKAVIPAQTRCPTCAEKHRAWNRQDSENHRRAKGTKPRNRISAELIKQIQQDIATKEASEVPKRVRNEAYKKKQREAQASLRAERDSLGLCRDCGQPRPEGQTLCHDCVIRHSRYWETYVAKGRTWNFEAEKTDP